MTPKSIFISWSCLLSFGFKYTVTDIRHTDISTFSKTELIILILTQPFLKISLI